MQATQLRGDGKFPTTEWTLVARLRNDDAEVGALDALRAGADMILTCFARHFARQAHGK